jgi:hypothetical protein
MMNMNDPVSGNPVPPGAMPSEVRDDVDIKASEGEYVVPADVVRFLGVEKLESLVSKAKESLAQMSQKGRIGGKPMPPEGNPMQRPPQPSGIAPPQPTGASPRPPGMAEGGVVAPGASSPSMAAYVGPDGKMVYIPLINGQPLTPIPAGYKPAGQAQQAVQPNRQSNSGGTSFLSTPQGASGQRQATSPEQWSVDDFVNYGNQLQSGVPDALMGAVNAVLPFSNILTGLAERNMQATVPGLIDQMIETGVDAQGNQITAEQREGLLNTRTVMADRIAGETGSRFNPFESLTNFVGRVIGGGSGTPSGQRASASMGSQPDLSSRSREAQAPSGGGGQSGPTSQSASGNMSVAPDKEDKDQGSKGFAYGGLIANKPAVMGFINKQRSNQTQPVMGGAPQGRGFMSNRNSVNV